MLETIMMKHLIQTFKQHVLELTRNPDFVHHQWFAEYHLEIVERISLELCDIHPEADRDAVVTLVWLHDYGKIIDRENQYQATLTKGKEKLLELGYPPAFTEKVIQYADLLDKKTDLNRAPLEVQIVSSADGASHLVGPFFSLWWYENHGKDYRTLMEDNIWKANVDWDTKIVLPEVKRAFTDRHTYVLERSGRMPERFLD